MKVIALDIANVKRITAVHLDVDGKSVILAGKNAQGKSSILDAIFYALGGGKSLPPKAVKTGEEKGEIVVRIGSPEKEYTVKRTLTAAGGGTLTVTSSDGFRATSPQALLDDLTSGGIAFDPLEFTRLKPAAQREALCQLTGLDVSAFDQTDATLRAERTAIGREMKSAEGYAANLPHHDDAPAEERTASELLAQIEAAEAKNRDRDKIIADGKYYVSSEASARDEADRLRAEAARLIAAAEQREREAADYAAKAAELRTKVPPAIDTTPIRAELDTLESANAKVRANAAKAAATARAEALAAEYKAFDTRIADNATAKVAAIAGVTMPIPGLALGADGVEFNGVPLSQASQAEQLRVSVAIAMARNPKLRVALIREAAVLDSDSMVALMEAAEAHDVQLFVERVGTDEPGAIVIEDGHVRGE